MRVVTQALIVVALVCHSAQGFQAPLAAAPAVRPSSTSSTTRLHIWNAVDSFFVGSPYVAAAVVCGVKACAADGVAQFQEWKERPQDDDTVEPEQPRQNLLVNFAEEGTKFVADWKRNLAFLLYGALYQGLTQEFIYNKLYPLWFGAGNGLVSVFSKVAFSLLVQTTVLTLPSLYLIKATVERKPWRAALSQYKQHVQHQGLLKKFYMLWGPVLTLTFGIVPEHLRVSFVALVSFFWLIILSSISSNSAAEKDEYCIVGQDVCEFDRDDNYSYYSKPSSPQTQQAAQSRPIATPRPA